MLDRNQLADYQNRRHLSTGGIVHAWRALDATRRAAEAGKVSSYVFANVNPWRAGSSVNPPMSDGCRWIENPAGAGLRFVGYADDLAGLSHRGWYTDPDGIDGTVARGAVYQLPARNRCAQYVPAMLDPHNDGPALFGFSAIYTGEKGGADYSYMHNHGDTAECARAADSIAENYAEREREYQTAWRAGADYADRGEDMASLRERARELVSAIRGTFNGSTATLREILSETLESLQELREERENLRDEYHVSPNNGLKGDYKTRRFAQWDAFKDGAGIA